MHFIRKIHLKFFTVPYIKVNCAALWLSWFAVWVHDILLQAQCEERSRVSALDVKHVSQHAFKKENNFPL